MIPRDDRISTTYSDLCAVYVNIHSNTSLKSLFIITIIFYGCNSNLLCYHGVVERNCISFLHSHGKAISLLFIIILLIYFYFYFLF